MSFRFIMIFCLLLLLIVSGMLLYYFYQQKRKYGFLGLLSFSVIGIVAAFGIIISITGEGITPKHALLLDGYSSAFYNEYNRETLESKDYVIYLDSLVDYEYPNTVITVKKVGLLYQTIENDFVSYTSENYHNGQSLEILTYQWEDKYIHFLKFGATYFEEIGHIGYFLPEKVLINGCQSEVNSYFYCFSDDEICTISVNDYEFLIKE